MRGEVTIPVTLSHSPVRILGLRGEGRVSEGRRTEIEAGVETEVQEGVLGFCDQGRGRKEGLSELHAYFTKST